MSGAEERSPQELADAVVEAVGDRAEAQVTVARTRHGLTRFANSFIHQHVGEDTTSVWLTLAIDGRVVSASTADVGREALERLVETTVAAARLGPVDPGWPGLAPPQEPVVTDRVDEPTLTASPEERVAEVAAFVDAASDLRAAGYVDSAGSWSAFANSAGQRLAGCSTSASLDGIHQTPTSAGSAHQTSRRLADLDGAAAGALAGDIARRAREATDVDPGDYEVVLGPDAVATLAGFVGFYGFNAQAWLDGQSFVRLDEPQLDPALTLLDDPTDPATVGAPFDAEGTPRQRTVLVGAGTSVALLHDRRTAAAVGDGARSTGNAVPGGAGVGAFPADLVVEGGATPADELVAGIERGLWVNQFHYCRVLDPRNLVVTGLTRNGTFLIEDGRIAGAVGNLRFTQSFVGALAPGRVRGVGDDVRYGRAESGIGTVRAPSLRLAGWRFTGGARG
ncbi:MAG: TldD/PmbA family protein [Actinobacteria bacterium]|nr:TldD/PmbA family protein [Actinomycetota bacterium]